jgi:ATP-binding cassette subfamily B protein
MAANTPPVVEEAMLKGYDPAIARRLAGFAKPYGKQLFIALLLMLTGSAMAVAGPYLIKLALDAGLEAGSLAALRQVVILT